MRVGLSRTPATLVFGPFWYRLLVDHAPLDPADASAHASQLLDGLRPSSRWKVE
jgi:hypothetical protein